MTVGGIIMISVLGGVLLAVVWFVLWFLAGEMKTHPVSVPLDVGARSKKLESGLAGLEARLAHDP